MGHALPHYRRGEVAKGGAMWLRNGRAHSQGQGLVEYALIILLVAITSVVALGALSGGLNAFYASVSGAF
jgi:Flp pilus assembly pilin Flp